MTPSVGASNCFSAQAISESRHLASLEDCQKKHFEDFADIVLSGIWNKTDVPDRHLVRARQFADPKNTITKMQTIMKKEEM